MHLQNDKAEALYTLLDSLFSLNRRHISDEAKVQILDRLLDDDDLLHIYAELEQRLNIADLRASA